MNRKKFTNICAMLLSFTMLFSTMQPLAAYATENTGGSVDPIQQASEPESSPSHTPTLDQTLETPTPTPDVSMLATPEPTVVPEPKVEPSAGGTNPPAMILENDEITITQTLPTTWVKAGSVVTFNYTVASAVDISEITIDGRAVTITNPKSHTNTMYGYTKNQNWVVFAKNKSDSGKTATANIHVNNIDQWLPSIKIPQSGTLTDAIFSDPSDPDLSGGKGFGGADNSGVNLNTVKLKAQLLDTNNKPDTNVAVINADSVAALNSKLIAGKSYRITANVEDNAGNVAAQVISNYTVGDGTSSYSSTIFTFLNELSHYSYKSFKIETGSQGAKITASLIGNGSTVTAYGFPKTLPANSAEIHGITVAPWEQLKISISDGNPNGNTNYIIYGAPAILTSDNIASYTTFDAFSKEYKATKIIGESSPFSKSIGVVESGRITNYITLGDLKNQAAGTKFVIVVKDSNKKDVLYIGAGFNSGYIGCVTPFTK